MTRRQNLTYVYRVRFRRVGWVHEKSRIFVTPAPMLRFVEKLLDGGRPDLAPVVEVDVDRAPVQAWERDWWSPMIMKYAWLQRFEAS